MAIYNIDGIQAFHAYRINGESVSSAYDVYGEQVFSTSHPLIKVMTYNVGQWYIGSGTNVPADKDAQYYDIQSRMIAENAPDVLCIQEYWKIFSKTGRTAKSMLEQFFPYIHEQGGDSGYFGRCICSKYPISNYTVRTFTNNSSRYYDSCIINIDNFPVAFINTHLDTDDSKRYAQALELISYLSTINSFVACGDYNMLDCKSASGTDYIQIIEPILNAGFNSANCSDFGFLTTYYGGNTTDTWDGCLDNIVTSHNIEITDAFVDETKLTDGITDKIDHMPLIATLQIGG